MCKSDKNAVGVVGMKKRIRELFAILLVMSLMFGSFGIETRAEETSGEVEIRIISEDGGSAKPEILLYCTSYVDECTVSPGPLYFYPSGASTVDLNKIMETILLQQPGRYTCAGYIYKKGGFDGSPLSSSIINLSDNNITEVYCIVCWKPNPGYNVSISNRSSKDISVAETDLNSNGTYILSGVDNIQGQTTDGLYQITSWRGYGDNEESVIYSGDTLCIGNNIDSIFETYYNENYLQYVKPLNSASSDIIVTDNDFTRKLTVSVDKNGDGIHSDTEKQEVLIGTEGIKPSDYTVGLTFDNTDKTFKNWNYILTESSSSNDKNITSAASNSLSVDELETYRCLQIDPTFTGTISFRDSLDSGTDYSFQTGDLGTAISFPDAEKPGYTFLGWSENKDAVSPDEGCSPDDSTYTIIGNRTLYAIWEKNLYTLTWNDSVENKAEEKCYGDPITLPADPSKPGYKFLGWYGYDVTNNNDLLVKCGDPFEYSMPSKNAIMTAKWDIAYTNISAGTYYLLPGHEYQLDAALTVSGDPNNYVSGVKIYVPTSGEYTFR